MKVFQSVQIADAFTKSEVNALIEAVKPHTVKLSMPDSATVTIHEDKYNIVQSAAATATGSITITFNAGFVPRSYSWAAQSNVTVGHNYPMPIDGTIQLVFKLVSTGGNFNPNEVILDFFKKVA